MWDSTFYSAHNLAYSRTDLILVSSGIAENVLSTWIGKWIYSDHALVAMVWNDKVRVLKQYNSCLNNFLLESKGLKEVIMAEIESFLHGSHGSVDAIVVWETFQVYIRGIFISEKSYRNKLHNRIRNELLQKIERLDQERRERGLATTLALLQSMMDQLKLLDAQRAAKVIIYAK